MKSQKEADRIKATIGALREIAVLMIVTLWEIWHLATTLFRR
ncbi:MAG TPA: hypothetical protein VN939_06025 [Chthoniobacterales bacterium]|nr:hypothetical protein [Chthoniobacterales bacterium]